MKHPITIEHPWSLESSQVLKLLDSAGEQGLSDTSVAQRLDLYGANTFHTHEKKSALRIFGQQLASPLIFILVGAAVVTGTLREWVEMVVIILAVVVNTGLGFYREYHAENTLEKLSSFIKDRSRVLRGGHEQEVDSETVVPGDILKLSYGSRVPADARVIMINNGRLDESLLTGESVPIEKCVESVSGLATVAERVSMIHAGTLVVDGFVTAVVTATGDSTEIGKIARLVSRTQRVQTPIQKGLSRLAWMIFIIVICIVVGIFALGIARGESVFTMLVLAVAVSVGAVPESLPIALTVILSIGAERIAKARGVTRTLIAAETLGSTTLIMTDKTGTLTEANMRLVGVFSAADCISGSIAPRANSSSSASLLEMALANVDILVENPTSGIAEWTFKGKPFEVNIVKAARELGVDVSRYTKTDSSLLRIPFNSTHKFSVSISQGVSTVMGAPDILLSRSALSESDRRSVEAWIASASTDGMRLIALAKKEVAIASVPDTTDLQFVGIMAFRDPIRAQVPNAIAHIQSLGIRVVMVTGDLKGTALAVAREIGWDVAPDQVLSGRDLQELTDQELLVLLPTTQVFARVTPEDKLRIGTLYRSLGHVVAMTGDGVNDAPSLKAMDIGVALGSGSDVAKSAADLVLLDDNFETISTAVQEGRRILVNIRKTFVYLMSNSLDEVFVIGGSLIVGIALPLTALQIIWVNLFTGSLPALAFAYDEDFDREKHTHGMRTSLFSREVNVLTFGIGIASSLLLFFLYYVLIRMAIDVAVARSVFFVCFASYILAISFSFRSLRKPLFSYPLFSNRRLNQSILIALAILILTMVLPVLRNLFGLAPMPLVWLWFVAGWLLLNIILIESAKYFFRKGTAHQ